MLQQRRHHVWSDKENGLTGDVGAKGFSKTPKPLSKATLVAGKPKAVTEGLRGKQRVLPTGSSKKVLDGKGKGVEEIEPQRLFKEAIQPPATIQRRNYLLDKTNTSKKPSTSSRASHEVSLKPSLQLAKTPGPKKSVRLAPATPAIAPKGKAVVEGRLEDEAFKTPAPGKRARRPPPMLATPEDPGADAEQGQVQDGPAGAQVWSSLGNGVEVPDVEYGPPTAIQPDSLDECEVVCDFEPLGKMLRGGMPLYVVDEWEGDMAKVILSEEKDTRWEPCPIESIATPEDEVLDLCDFVVPDPKSKPKPASKPAPSKPTLAPLRRPIPSTGRISRPAKPTPAPRLASAAPSRLAPGKASAPARPPDVSKRPKLSEGAQRVRQAAQEAVAKDLEGFVKGDHLDGLALEMEGQETDDGLEEFRFDV